MTLFRIWDVEAREIVNEWLAVDGDGKPYCVNPDCPSELEDDGSFMLDWSTGLTDSAGTPIFQRDMLSVPVKHKDAVDRIDTRTLVAEWSSETGAWCMFENVAGGRIKIGLLSDYAKKGTITGRAE
jgi:hypothetical protein